MLITSPASLELARSAIPAEGEATIRFDSNASGKQHPSLDEGFRVPN